MLLTGAAVSHVFDGERDLGEGTLLRGVRARADVGLLTLFEHYRRVAGILGEKPGG